MENPLKGEVALEADGERYLLQFSIDALCRLEAATGMVLPALLSEMSSVERISLTRVRQLLHAGLSEHHPEIDQREAGELIKAAGGMQVVLGQIVVAINAAFPEASGTPRPPQAPNRQARRRAGTGKRS